MGGGVKRTVAGGLNFKILNVLMWLAAPHPPKGPFGGDIAHKGCGFLLVVQCGMRIMAGQSQKTVAGGLNFKNLNVLM